MQRVNMQRVNMQRVNIPRLLEEKRDGGSWTPEQLRAFLDGYLRGAVPEYQMSAYLMAVVHQGLDAHELEVLVDVMVGSGTRLAWKDLDKPVVDKHSTGGVGDKVSIALAPLAAELGLAVPMMSGRGLGHTGGTLDKLEAIPGFQTNLDLSRFRELVREHGFAMISQTADIAPLDKRLYALRSVTGTVPSIPLIASSIMSKKLAEGLDALVLDVKTGSGAFLRDDGDLRELASTMEALGESRGVDTEAVFTEMDAPLGLAIGNGLETREAIQCLRGGGPRELRKLVVDLAARMVRLGAGTSEASARAAAEDALDSGHALERFSRVVAAQGGDPGVVDTPDLMITAPVRLEVEASRSGTVAVIEPRALGWGVVDLGGGRTALDQDIRYDVGFELTVRRGDAVRAGQVLGVVHAANDADAAQAGAVLRKAVVIR